MTLVTRLLALERQYAPRLRQRERTERALTEAEWAGVLWWASSSGQNAELIRRLTAWPPSGQGLGLGMREEDAERVAEVATAFLCELGAAYLTEGMQRVFDGVCSLGFDEDQADRICFKLFAVHVVGGRDPRDPERALRVQDFHDGWCGMTGPLPWKREAANNAHHQERWP